MSDTERSFSLTWSLYSFSNCKVALYDFEVILTDVRKEFMEFLRTVLCAEPAIAYLIIWLRSNIC